VIDLEFSGVNVITPTITAKLHGKAERDKEVSLMAALLK
jgi:hypothetical protein